MVTSGEEWSVIDWSECGHEKLKALFVYGQGGVEVSCRNKSINEFSIIILKLKER